MTDNDLNSCQTTTSFTSNSSVYLWLYKNVSSRVRPNANCHLLLCRYQMLGKGSLSLEGQP